jgi:hypothetical protein
MSETDGFTYMADEVDFLFQPGATVWACDTCGERFVMRPDSTHDEMPAHQLEHDQPDPPAPDPFAEMTQEELAAFLAETPLAAVDASIRQALLNRCNDFGIEINTYPGWLEGALAP